MRSNREFGKASRSRSAYFQGNQYVSSGVHAINTGPAKSPNLRDAATVYLEDAFRIAHTQIVQWIAKDTGLSIMDTYQLVSQAARSRIANVCDANYTIVAKVPKRFLPSDIPWMNGVHQKMRARAKAVIAARQPR